MKTHLLHNKDEKNQFGYNLGEVGGSITFGGPDKRSFPEGDKGFIWAPTIKFENYWTVTLMDVRK